MTEERILEITNRVSEDMPSGATKAELVECVRHWSQECSKEASKRAFLEGRVTIAHGYLLLALEANGSP